MSAHAYTHSYRHTYTRAWWAGTLTPQAPTMNNSDILMASGSPLHTQRATQDPPDTHTHTHTPQYIEGSLVTKHTPRHSIHIIAKGTQSLRAPKQTYKHTHRQVTHVRQGTQGQVPDAVTKNTQGDTHTTYPQAQIQATQHKEIGSTQTGQGPETRRQPTLSPNPSDQV